MALGFMCATQSRTAAGCAGTGMEGFHVQASTMPSSLRVNHAKQPTYFKSNFCLMIAVYCGSL